MSVDERVSKRRSEFARNDTLEALLHDVNNDMALAEKQAMARYRGQQPKMPPIFIMGPPRCGSTLFTQWLASTGACAYPTNLLSRFWAAPIVGARIQKLLTDPEYDFRGELQEFQGATSFDSHHGKTAGALSPNEFWYFWRRFLPGNDYQERQQLERLVDVGTLQSELAGLTDVLGKPFVTKGMIFNENIPFIAEKLPKAIFVWLRRQPEYNIQSLLQARQRQYGEMNTWYSFKIRQYNELAGKPPLQSVSGQVAAIHASIESGVSKLADERVLSVDYESFCCNPAKVYADLAARCASISQYRFPNYKGPEKFEVKNEWSLKLATYEEVNRCYQNA